MIGHVPLIKLEKLELGGLSFKTWNVNIVDATERSLDRTTIRSRRNYPMIQSEQEKMHHVIVNKMQKKHTDKDHLFSYLHHSYFDNIERLHEPELICLMSVS